MNRPMYAPVLIALLLGAVVHPQSCAQTNETPAIQRPDAGTGRTVAPDQSQDAGGPPVRYVPQPAAPVSKCQNVEEVKATIRYPEQAQRRGILTGVAFADWEVGPDGSIVSGKFEVQASSRSFLEEIIAAIRRLRCTQGHYQWRIEFKTDNSPPALAPPSTGPSPSRQLGP